MIEEENSNDEQGETKSPESSLTTNIIYGILKYIISTMISIMACELKLVKLIIDTVIEISLKILELTKNCVTNNMENVSQNSSEPEVLDDEIFGHIDELIESG